MFESFFGNRVKKDIEKLEHIRKGMIGEMLSWGVSQEHLDLFEKESYSKARAEYLRKPDIRKALDAYYASLKSGMIRLGYEVK